jgi:hypothetical protein
VIPEGTEVTELVPIPVPESATVNPSNGANVAVVDVAALGIAILQVVLVPALAQTPSHPVKTTPGAGIAVRTIGVPDV